MLHNEARKLLIQAWNKTQNVKEVPACFGSKRKSSWQAVHDWIHGTAHTAAKEFSWNYWTASSNVTVIKFKINLQESLHNHFVWKCLNAYVSGNWNHQKKSPKKPGFIRNQASNGAARQIRTADLILTKDALYLLSYSSMWRFFNLQHYGDPERARTVDL